MDRHAKAKPTIEGKLKLVEECVLCPDFRKELTENIAKLVTVIPAQPTPPAEEQDNVSPSVFFALCVISR